MTASTSRRRFPIGLWVAGIGLIVAGLSLSLFLKAGDVGSGPQSSDFSASPIRVEFETPELALRDLLGHEAALTDLRGQVVLLNLWATWCPPCKAEMPIYQEFYVQHRLAGFTVVAINDGEAPGAVTRFVADRGLTFPVWLDPKYEASEVVFRTRSLPTSYVIDRTGVVRLMWIGAIDKSTLDEYVTPLIEE